MHLAIPALTRTALVTLLGVSVLTAPVHAQQDGAAGQTGQQTQQQTDQSQTGQSQTGQDQQQTDQTGRSQQQTGQDQAAQGQPQAGAGDGQTPGDTGPGALVATVGDAEIREADVMTVIGMLPPQLQSQPPQMLVPLALEQLVMRELILQEARAQNLGEDPEVRQLIEGAQQNAEEDAMVQVWLNRELQGVVTDEAVQQAYSDLQGQSQQELPPIEQIRPDIERLLRQQAMQDVRTRLRQDADVVFYGAGGQPLDPQPGSGLEQGQAGQGGAAAGATVGQGGDAATGQTGNSGNAGEAGTQTEGN